MKIVGLIAENVKKLTAVEIAPSGAVIEVTGKNGNGKTSVLDAIWWALAGAKHIQAAPIRRGADSARIRLDLGEIKVTRKFERKGDDDFTTSLIVENAAGNRAPSPQKVLDDLVGALTFDPLEFANADAQTQWRMIRDLMPEIDFDGVDKANKEDFAARTDLNRQAKTLRAQAAGIEAPIGTPKQPIDEAALVAELEAAGQHNAEVAQRRARREQAKTDIAQAEVTADARRKEAADLLEHVKELNAQADRYAADAASMRAKLEAAPPLPDPIDTAALVEQIATAKRTNAHVAARQRHAELLEQATGIEAQAQALTAAMDRRKEALAAQIAAAQLPVPGLSFDDGAVLLNGLPFDQASTAEQLRTSIAIAMRMNPKLRVLRIRHGNDLDDDSMAILAEMVEGADYQCWVEKINASGKSFVVIENGEVIATEAGAAA
ncbi:AAA domain-containing protein [Rhodopseudomonas faecalis]|uniref:AAA domain-containing protein n=1 Tax=Rhodopseudomonas faecalis TaxID=99655 RepID=A0A318TZC5_9BRAD|nr:AAA family ATPase [Rhodopseudomonas faecalis]PYF04989.1 AAA domain-containing protein [Rhodopseudomonas faecalis]